MNKIIFLAMLAIGYYFWTNQTEQKELNGHTEALTAQECSNIGGHMDNNGDCILPPTENQCRELGGQLASDGSCIVAFSK